MAGDAKTQVAWELLQRAYQLHSQGDLAMAIDLYRQSIALHPTAEAHVNLASIHRLQGRLDDAMGECREAIRIDPSLGNPYNEIGVCLVDLGRAPEAVEWLEKATSSQRYDSYHLPWYHLGRAYSSMELYRKARECFLHALDIEPAFEPAESELARLRRLVQ
jgi:tetratricopeptide (TPR) repeat protein